MPFFTVKLTLTILVYYTSHTIAYMNLCCRSYWLCRAENLIQNVLHCETDGSINNMKKCKFPGCHYQHKYPYWIKQHEIIHSSDPKVRRPHECQHCGYRSGSKYKLKDHMALHTAGKKFMCFVSGCDYSTHNKEYLRMHEKTHNSVQMPCDFKGCNYKSKRKPTLKAHIASHCDGVREKNIECPLCAKMFHKFTSMKSHLRSHSNEKPWQCSLCSFEAKLKDSLNKHLEAVHGELRSKSREQLFQTCQLCDFTTTFNKRFRRHLASHSEERPFPCTFPGCSFRAKRRDSLKTHGKTHSPQEFRCPEPGCSHSHVSKNRGPFYVHQRMHNKSFECVFQNCWQKFQKETGLLYSENGIIFNRTARVILSRAVVQVLWGQIQYLQQSSKGERLWRYC